MYIRVRGISVINLIFALKLNQKENNFRWDPWEIEL